MDRELAKRLIVGWGLGTLPMAIYFNAFNILALRYLTDVVGLAAATAGLLISVSKIYDAVTDPLMGAISDRTKGTMGRRRPYLLLGGLLCGLSIYALFTVPQYFAPEDSALIVGGLLIVYATCYTIYNVPYMSMPAEMTSNSKNRSEMMSYRVICIGAGGLIAGTVGPKIVGYGGGGAAGHETMGLSLGIVIAALAVVIFFVTRGAHSSSIPVQAGAAKMPMSEKLAAVWGNKPFIQLLVLKLFLLMGVAISSATLAFFIVTILGRGYGDLGTIILFTTLGQILGTPLWLKISRKLGKRRTFYASAVIFAAISMTWMFADASEPLWLTGSRVFAKGLGTGGILLISQAMLPDTIEYDRLRTGLAREGALSGLYTTIEKVAFAFGTALTGLFLDFMGYIPRAETQSSSAVSAIYACQATLPALLMLLAAALLIFYKLTDEKLESMRAQGQAAN
jgi:GPH family glycoside/pentoside/hexuronide:cation symporter